mmetsp:Transcript_2148/g.6547  ORF Transcript_2148/g.6547 Transcript_2148/m.6547 type:complete len:202 (+) Transcript_2148:1273-1878(+)
MLLVYLIQIEMPLEDLEGISLLPRVVLDDEDGLLVCDALPFQHAHDNSQVPEPRAVDEYYVWFASRPCLQPTAELLARHLPLEVGVEVGVEALARPLVPFASFHFTHDVLAEVFKAQAQLVDNLHIALLLPPPLRVLKDAGEALEERQAPVSLLLLALVVEGVYQMIGAARPLRRSHANSTDGGAAGRDALQDFAKEEVQF